MTDHPTVYSFVDSPIGRLLLVGRGGAVVGVHVADHERSPTVQPDWRRDDGALRQVATQLEEYFAGDRETFDVALALEGTPFQRSVWEALLTVGYGHTASYRDIAERIGRPTATRAVGLANGRNPVSIIVPCHRIIGASGALTGYGWGVDRKAWLLAHEGVVTG